MRRYILAVHQYETEVWLYCISELHAGLCRGSGLQIQPRESRGRDAQAAALKELHADSTFDQ